MLQYPEKTLEINNSHCSSLSFSPEGAARALTSSCSHMSGPAGSPVVSSSHLCLWKLSELSRNLLDLLRCVPSCAVTPAGPGGNEVLHEDRGCWLRLPQDSAASSGPCWCRCLQQKCTTALSVLLGCPQILTHGFSAGSSTLPKVELQHSSCSGLTFNHLTSCLKQALNIRSSTSKIYGVTLDYFNLSHLTEKQI